jgi:FG-GAP repeat
MIFTKEILISGNILPRLTALLLALGFCPGAGFAQGNSASLLTTINNPTPAAYDIFGESVAAVGTDRVLVGANGAGEAYLFNLNGTLLTTFVNPEVAGGGGFGASVAAVGGDRVLVGATDFNIGVAQVGRAYLFRTNGTLLTIFTNPAPATVQALGWALAAVGSDRVLISGLANVNKPGPYPGGVYLFSTNGTLLKTFPNPHPATDAGFGIAVAAMGDDRLLVGAAYDNTGASGAGSAYLFGTNGTLLNTFTNPIPAANDNFGTAVAAVGSDRVLVSAIDYGGVKGTGGAAYLFSTNGTLLTTITNPTPAAGDYFGWSVAAVGGTRVLIGAYGDGTGASQAGAAYLFSTNGTLLTTITNPTPAIQDWFGAAVAAAGNDRVIIGGVWDDTGATDAGSAYVYTLLYPPLNIAQNAGAVSLSWATAETGLILQQSDRLSPSPEWNDTTNPVSVNGLTNMAQSTMGTDSRFFRLRRP